MRTSLKQPAVLLVSLFIECAFNSGVVNKNYALSMSGLVDLLVQLRAFLLWKDNRTMGPYNGIEGVILTFEASKTLLVAF